MAGSESVVATVLQELRDTLREPGFVARAAEVEQKLRQAGASPADWSLLQEIWGDFREFQEMRRLAAEIEAGRLEEELGQLASRVEETDFPRQATRFRELLAHSHALTDGMRERLRSRYQALTAERRLRGEQRREQSAGARQAWEARLEQELPPVPDAPGPPAGEEGPPGEVLDRWADLADAELRHREAFKQLQAGLNGDEGLLPRDRGLLLGLVRARWQAGTQLIDEVGARYTQAAQEVLTQAEQAVAELPGKQALAALRALRADARRLWLRRGDRARLLDAFDGLRDQLRDRQAAQQAAWIARQEDGVRRLEEARRGVLLSRERVEASRQRTEEQICTARSDEFRFRAVARLEEEEAELGRLAQSLAAIDAKLAAARQRLAATGWQPGAGPVSAGPPPVVAPPVPGPASAATTLLSPPPASSSPPAGTLLVESQVEK